MEGLGKLSGKVKLIPLGKLPKREIDKTVFLSKTWDKELLKKTSMEGFDVGYGVLSSFISKYRNPDISFIDKQDKIKEMLINSLDVYFRIYDYLEVANPDELYLFNGRYAYYRAAFRAARKLGLKTYCHERGCNIQHYCNHENVMPHDSDYFHTQMLNAWDEAVKKDKDAAFKIGASFYEERQKNIEQSWYSFTKTQHKNLLPVGWDEKKYNIVIYNSSEDEFEAVGTEWQHLLYTNQLVGIKKILDSVKEKDIAADIKIYLRMHPSLKEADPRYVASFYGLDYPFFEVIPPESSVD
ncbi:MAG: hypothetical protein PHV82_05075, partial [Victivallaceae bacterium]|nr:hypothetical protein [Victivallaceae bacterium]